MQDVLSAPSLSIHEPFDHPYRAGAPRSSKLLDQVRDAIRLKHYSIRTEEAYVDWIKRFILFHKTPEGRFRHPQDMGAAEIAAFLPHLAVDKNVAASTPNQALSALLFLYRNVLGRDVSLSGDVLRAKKPRRLPTVLTKEEASPFHAAAGEKDVVFERPRTSCLNEL